MLREHPNAGILTDPWAPSSFGPWLNHAGNQHIGALLFLISDGFLFMGVAALTCMQISQVWLGSAYFILYCIKFIMVGA